jgi:hypothetical protein
LGGGPPRERKGASPGRSVRRVGGAKTGSGGQARTPSSRARLFNLGISDIDSNSFRYADRHCGLTWGIAFDIWNPTLARRRTDQNRWGATDSTQEPSRLTCVRLATLRRCWMLDESPVGGRLGLDGRWRPSRARQSQVVCKKTQAACHALSKMNQAWRDGDSYISGLGGVSVLGGRCRTAAGCRVLGEEAVAPNRPALWLDGFEFCCETPAIAGRKAGITLNAASEKSRAFGCRPGRGAWLVA